MSDGWFALGGAALGFASAFGVEWFRQRADKKTASEVFQRTTLLELQETADSFLKAMGDLFRHTVLGLEPLPNVDVDEAQDRARELGRRIRILASRVTDRKVEQLATNVFQGAYGALAARTSLEPSFKAFETKNDYIGTLVR